MINKSFYIILGILFAFSSCTNKSNTCESAKKYDSSTIDSLFQHSIDHHHMPAAAAYIWHNDEIAYYKVFGMRDLENEIPLKKGDLFRIASMTKVITAVAIMQLYERGLLFLDDPLYKFIPEFKDPQILLELMEDSSFTSKAAEHQITIRQLMTHTSGIAYGFQSDTYNAMVVKNGVSEGFEERNITTIENARNIAKLPLVCEPGEKYTYSLSYDVLGAVVEVVSGQRLDHYFQQYIFGPLGMNDSYFYLPKDKIERLVKPYEYNAERNGFITPIYPYRDYPFAGAQSYFSGGADVSCSIYDMGLFAQMLLNDGALGEVRILSSRAVEMMKTVQSPHNWWDWDGGLSLSIRTQAGAAHGPFSEGSYGWGGFWDTYCWVDPSHDLIAILFLQMYPNNEYKIHEKFEQITYKYIND